MNTVAKIGVFLMGVGLCAQAAVQFIEVAVSAALLDDIKKGKFWS